jgi:dTDP-4-dehydrorhamnose 3,5-epimerase
MSVRVIETRRYGDDRGWFAETYSQPRFAALGIDTVFVQDNHSLSHPRGVLRGLHYQAPPHAQAKLVRCVRGRIWDVAVDIRKGSPSFGRWFASEISQENGRQLFVPIGFAHGFLTLEPDCEVEYKVSDIYAPQCEGGLVWDDPDLAIPWPLEGGNPVMSPKDQALPRLRGFVSPFAYDAAAHAPVGALS